MNDGSDTRRILDLLASGQISTEQAESLLEALAGENGSRPENRETGPGSGRRVRSLQVKIDADENGRGKNVAINIPLGLARFAARFLPAEARQQLEEQGVDLAGLINSFDEELPAGNLLEIDAGEGEKTARITIKAV